MLTRIINSDNFFDGFSMIKNHLLDTELFTERMPVNIKEGESNFTIEVALPGVEKKDISIQLEKDQLMIKSQKNESKEIKEEKYHYQGISQRSFNRSFKIPNTVNQDGISSSMNDGILKIELPKVKKEEIPKQIKSIEIQ